MRRTLGSLLHSADREHVLRAYVYRYTREHVPSWAKKSPASPVQFASDAEWLSNTTFAVRKDGRLDERETQCESYPTWPDGLPEGQTRRGYAERFTSN